MGLYSDTIIKREENNRKLENLADESLIRDKKMVRIENEMDDVQTAVLFILEKFGIRAARKFGYINVRSLLGSILDPLGMIYDYADSVESRIRDKTEYILAFREDGKAVAITPSIYGYRWYCPHDSGSGRVTKAYCRTLQKGCYIFNRPIEERKTIHETFFVNVFKQLTIYDVLKLAVLSLMSALLGLVLPRITEWIYDVYLQDADAHVKGFLFMLVLFLTVNLVRSTLTMMKGTLLNRTTMRISMKMQSAVMAKVLHLPQSFFMENNSGKLSKRISNCGRLSDMMLSIVLDVLLDFSFSGVYLAQMKRLAPELFLPALLFLVLKIILSVISAIYAAKNEEGAIEAEMDNSYFLYSSIRGIQKIKGMGAQKFVYSKWAELYRKILAYNYKKPFILKYQNILISAVTTCATITLMGLTSFHDLSREEYMTFTASYVLAITVVTSLTNMLENNFVVRTLSRNVEPIFTAQTEQSASLEYVRNLRGDIKIEDVYFKYPDTQQGCLKGVSIDVKRGEKLAIVGESGCGKTTLLKMLIGFERPDNGMIYFDDKPIDALNLTSLRQNIGSVFQFSRLIPGTIASNVTLTASREVTEDMIWDALDKAAIGDYVRKTPLQLDTEISESNSSGFSGGQRQRILLARAYVNDPDILILDEATSALDNITQKQVLDELMKMKTTVLMVAHRLSTVEHFDRIILLDQGRIAEEGTYEELMQMNGRFAELVRKQIVNETKKTGK